MITHAVFVQKKKEKMSIEIGADETLDLSSAEPSIRPRSSIASGGSVVDSTNLNAGKDSGRGGESSSNSPERFRSQQVFIYQSFFTVLLHILISNRHT